MPFFALTTRPLELLVAVANAPPASATESFGPFTFSHANWVMISRGGSIVATLLTAWILVRLIPLLERLVARFARKHESPRDATASTIDAHQRLATLGKVTSSIAHVVIGTTTAIVVLGDLGIAVAPLLATAGVAGVAIGFGAQSIVKDFFSGFFILLENQFDVGDTITVNTVTGTVERMTLRLTVLRDAAGTAYFFPNSNVVNVANRSYGWVRAALDLSFAPRLPAGEVRSALEAVAAQIDAEPELRKVLVDPTRAEGPVDFASGAVIWRIAAKVRPGFVDEVRAAAILALTEEIGRRGWTLTGTMIG